MLFQCQSPEAKRLPMVDAEATKIRLPRTGTLILIAMVLVVSGGFLSVWLLYHREQQAILRQQETIPTKAQAISGIRIVGAKLNQGFEWSDLENPLVPEEVMSVDLSNSDVSDAGLVHLQWFNNLKELSLLNTRIGDAGLQHLRELTNLKYLILENTKASDEGLMYLSELKNLEILTLGKTHVSGQGLRYFRGLDQLKELRLEDSQVSDPALKNLRGMQLESLFLGNTEVTSVGLQHLQGLPFLTELYLDDTQIGDAGLEHLQWLTNLKYLWLATPSPTRAQESPECDLRGFA